MKMKPLVTITFRDATHLKGSRKETMTSDSSTNLINKGVNKRGNAVIDSTLYQLCSLVSAAAFSSPCTCDPVLAQKTPCEE